MKNALTVTALLFGFLGFGASAQLLHAQTSPADYLGYELGDRFTPHHEILNYFETIAGESDKVELQKYGESYERRPLKAAFISSPENMERLDEIRQNNLRLAGLEDGDPDEDAPAIVWLAYNIHGNESSSSEVAMKALYSLTGGDERAEEWLENTVVVIDPGMNPDGRERYINWYTQVAGVDADPRHETREHHEPWPGGRFNHYYFDLNRDWAWQTQQESKYRTQLYLEWHPHIHADFHEMGFDSPYYFAPAADPFHVDITDWQKELQTLIGKNHAEYFDEDYRLYYTREVFDLFYPSYGDTWPTFNGAIGMTYEQAGHGQAGRAVITAEGDTLTLAQRIRNHHTVSLSTVEVASREQSRIAEEFQAYHQESVDNPAGDYNTWLIRGDNHPDKLKQISEYLERNKIEFGYADPPRRNQQSYNYKTGERERVEIREDDLIIPASQPKSRLAKVLFEPQTEIVDSLTYDITAWSLPYAYGLEAYAVESDISMREEGIRFADYEPHQPEGKPYAYIVRWETISDAAFLTQVLKHDIRLRIATQEFKMEGETFEPGTVVLTRNGNEEMGDRFDEIIQKYAEKYERPLYSVATGFAEEGIDLGSNNMRHLEKPSVALIAGEDVSSTGFGELRHFFERELNFPLAVIDMDQATKGNLRDYDVVLLASGNYSSSALNRFKDWMNEGGRLVTIGNAVSNLSGISNMDALSLNLPDEAADYEGEVADQQQGITRRFGDQQRDAATEAVRGSIYRIQLDNTHPLAYGYDEHYFTLKNNTIGLEPFEQGWNVGYLERGSHLSGFAGHKARDEYESSMVIGHNSMGSGELVVFADNPIFRSFWHNGKMMIANSVFMVGL